MGDGQGGRRPCQNRAKRNDRRKESGASDLEQSKAAVLNSLTSESGQRTYDHAITEFVDWYCSEPRLAFNRTVVLRYRIYLEQSSTRPRRLICDWLRFGGSLSRLPTPACLVRNWPPGFDE